MAAPVWIFLLALVVRLMAWHTQGTRLDDFDSQFFLQIAQNLWDHHAFSLQQMPPYTPTTLRPPVYPAFLAVLGGRPTFISAWVPMVQIVVASAIATAVYFLARPLSSERRAVAAAVLYAVHPEAVVFSYEVMCEVVLTALVVSGVMLYVLALKRDRIWLSAASGALLGLSALCRTLGLLYPLLLLLYRPPQASRRLLHGAAMLLVFCVTLSPWAVRSSMLAGRPVLVQGYGAGAMFYSAWRIPQAVNALRRKAVETGVFPEVRPYDMVLADPVGRLVWNARNPQDMWEGEKLAMALTVNKVRNDPAGYAALMVPNYPNLFISTCQHALYLNDWVDGMLARIGICAACVVVFSLLPLAAGVIGFLQRRHQAEARLYASFWLVTLVVFLPMWTAYRYWLEVFPFLLANASCFSLRKKSDP